MRRVLVGLVCLLPSCLHALPWSGDRDRAEDEPATVAGCSERLRSSELSERQEACRQLGELGKDDETALTPLIRALDDSEAQVRAEAAKAIGSMKRSAQGASERLTDLLEDADAGVRIEAALALWRITDQAELAVATLRKELWPVRQPVGDSMVAAALQMFDELMVDVAALGSSRFRAVECLGVIGPAARAAVPDLKGLLSHRSVVIRMEVVRSLCSIGEPPVPLIPVLVEALDPKHACDMTTFFGTGHAVGMLASMGPEGRRAALACGIQLLEYRPTKNSPDEPINLEGVMAGLAKLGPGAAEAIPALARHLKNKDAWTRVCAAYTIWQIDSNSPLPLPVLIDVLRKHNEDFGRTVAARAVANMGAAAEPAVPALQYMLKSWDGCDRYEAVKALAAIGPGAKPAIPALIALLRDRKPYVRKEAAMALPKIDPDWARTTAKVE